MNRLTKIFKNIYMLTFLFIFIFSLTFIEILNKKAMPIIIDYANVQTKKIGIEVIRNTGIKEVNKAFNGKEIFKTTLNKNGEIEMIDLNTELINESLIIIAKNVRKRLKEVEEGKNLPPEMYRDFFDKKNTKGIIFNVPMGVASNNAFFANLGPKIPVQIEYTGTVGLDIKTKVKQYGVNSALIEVYVYVEVNQRTIIPFRSKDVKLTSEIPVIIKVIKGETPYYLTNSNRSYSLPIN